MKFFDSRPSAEQMAMRQRLDKFDPAALLDVTFETSHYGLVGIGYEVPHQEYQRDTDGVVRLMPSKAYIVYTLRRDGKVIRSGAISHRKVLNVKPHTTC